MSEKPKILRSLTDEEFDALPSIPEERMREAVEAGRATRQEALPITLDDVSAAAVEMRRLRAEVTSLREALEWYADRSNYEGDVVWDAGKRARKAIGR